MVVGIHVGSNTSFFSFLNNILEIFTLSTSRKLQIQDEPRFFHVITSSSPSHAVERKQHSGACLCNCQEAFNLEYRRLSIDFMNHSLGHTA